MILADLQKKKLISSPNWLIPNCCYVTIMGSVAYGVSGDTSDCDLYGFCVPKKELIFPHLTGEIPGFGYQEPRFEQFQHHGIKSDGRVYDIVVYSVVRYFHLFMENNPNIIDSIFTPASCVVHQTKIGGMVRDNRRMFLHKGSYHKWKNYAFSQLNKVANKVKNPLFSAVWSFEEKHQIPRDTTWAAAQSEPVANELAQLSLAELKEYRRLYQKLVQSGKKYEKIKIQSVDTKFLYHVVRLLDECEQILTTGDLDIQRDRERLKAIRRGEWTEQQVRDLFAAKEKELERMYTESKLPYSPPTDRIKALLFQCLEEHYGSLDKCIVQPDKAMTALQNIKALLEQAGV